MSANNALAAAAVIAATYADHRRAILRGVRGLPVAALVGLAAKRQRARQTHPGKRWRK